MQITKTDGAPKEMVNEPVTIHGTYQVIAVIGGAPGSGPAVFDLK